MRYLFFLLAVMPAFAERFSFVQYGDIHASFGSSYNQYATNTIPWILARTNDGVFNFAGVIWTGDCFEDDVSLTNNYDPTALTTNGPVGPFGSIYAGTQLTNDARILSQSGLLFFATDGNHDANNTNNTVTRWCNTNIVNPWNTTFPPGTWTNQSYYSTNKDANVYNNLVMKFTRGNIKLKFISYHSEPNDTAYPTTTYAGQTTWVNQQIDADRDYNCIVGAHFFLGQSSNSFFDIVPSFTDHNGAYSNYNIGPGNAPIEGGILSRPNILAFMSGHDVPLLKGIYITNGSDGHKVTFVQFNTQQSNTRQNCDWINVLTFDTVSSTVSCGTYSISEARWIPDYEITGTFTNRTFPSGFRHTFTTALPIRPPQYPVLRR